MTPRSPDLLIFRFLAARTHASAAEVGAACGMAPGEVRGRLASLESRHLITGRQDVRLVPPRRVFYVTTEGRRAVGISDARSTQDA